MNGDNSNDGNMTPGADATDEVREENSAPEMSRGERFIRRKGIMNLPNQLTIFRLILIPLFVVFFFVKFQGHYFVALAVFVIAGATDAADGIIARKYHLITNFGKFLDPIADKVLVATVFVLFLVESGDFFTAHLSGSWVMIVAGCGVAIILARELIVSGFRTVAAGEGVVIAADMFGKYKTTTQDITIGLLLICAGTEEFTDAFFIEVLNYISLGFFAVAIVLTVLSGINYIVKNRAILKV